MKTYYILNLPPLVARMCREGLDEENFHQKITVTKGTTEYTGPAWEVSLNQLRSIREFALTQGFMVDFKVATCRLESNTFRFVEKSEWHEGTIRREREKKSIMAFIKQSRCNS